MVKKVLSILVLLVGVLSGFAQSKQQWVDSVFLKLSTEEKIGQLFLLQADLSSPEARHRVLNETKTHRFGGLLITNGSASFVKSTTQQLQEVSKIPLLIGMEAEWGAGKVLDSALSFPKPLFLSTLQDSLLQETAYQISLQLKSLGINLNIVSSALLPTGLTGDTLYSFWGNEPQHSSKRLLFYLQNLQREGILVCAKNFPAQLANVEGTAGLSADSSRRVGSWRRDQPGSRRPDSCRLPSDRGLWRLRQRRHGDGGIIAESARCAPEQRRDIPQQQEYFVGGNAAGFGEWPGCRVRHWRTHGIR